MRADRLLSILMTLQLRRLITASELSKQMEVSTRTIFRDLDALCQSGVPIVADRGRTGGVRLVEGYQTKLTGLSADEARALPFASVGLAAAALGLGGTAEAARLKVLAAIPSAGRERADQASQRFHVDPMDWYRRSATPKHLRIVAEAVWAGRVVELDYESWSARRKRVVDPLGLVLKGGNWYLVARQRKRLSIYRLENVHDVNVLPQTYAQPRNFNLASVWRDQVLRFEESLRRSKAEIRFAESAMSRVGRLGADAEEAIHAAKSDRSGWRRATIWIESIDHAAGMLLAFGSEIEVLSPEKLRVEIAKRAGRVCALYGSIVQTREL
jgi:predicted DNA-binding transcriptional regulator YafY